MKIVLDDLMIEATKKSISVSGGAEDPINMQWDKPSYVDLAIFTRLVIERAVEVGRRQMMEEFKDA